MPVERRTVVRWTRLGPPREAADLEPLTIFQEVYREFGG